MYLPQKDKKQGIRTKIREGEQRRRGREEGRWGKGICPGGDKRLPLNRGETDSDHRKMVVYKGERGIPY